MVRHTPGLWGFCPCLTGSENSRGFMIYQSPKGWGLAHVHPLDPDGKEGEANARLIAAAPDLLAACLMYRDMITPAAECCDAMDRAIEKATGGKYEA